MAFLNAGVPVSLVEMDQATLDRGVVVIRKTYENAAAKGRMSAEQVEQRMALVTPALGLEALKEADLVIEAVFEEIGVKQDVFARLDGIAKPGAILASNTASLDLDAIASATSRPESVIGLHFFAPANVMRLIEIVRGAGTSNAVLATALKLAKTIGKVPVVSRVGPGFIANRVMGPHRRQAIDLLLEGPTPLDIDQAIVARLLYPVVNEGAKVLEDGIAIRASDIDVACILGYNWPVYTGGPMFWADTVGLSNVVEGLRAMGIEPARLLAEKAASGGNFTR
jgi:3-hydroxyacyl-CoA dehydrogenase